MHNRTLKDYVWRAYLVQPDRVIGGPPWLDSERFDINAKAEEPIDDDRVLMAMLRTLLEDRFKLKLHRERRMGESVILGVGESGGKLRASSTEPSSYNNAHDHLDATNLTMDQFAEILARDLGLPVVDRTGLNGAFSFTLRWNPDGLTGANPEDAVAYLRSEMSRAVARQLGLTLKFRRTPAEILVIDHAEQPLEN